MPRTKQTKEQLAEAGRKGGSFSRYMSDEDRIEARKETLRRANDKRKCKKCGRRVSSYKRDLDKNGECKNFRSACQRRAIRNG